MPLVLFCKLHFEVCRFTADSWTCRFSRSLVDLSRYCNDDADGEAKVLREDDPTGLVLNATVADFTIHLTFADRSSNWVFKHVVGMQAVCGFG